MHLRNLFTSSSKQRFANQSLQSADSHTADAPVAGKKWVRKEQARKEQVRKEQTQTEQPQKKQSSRTSRLITTGFWFCCALVGFDVAVNRLFPYPADPNTSPGTLNLYFDYGRSLEGKIARQIGPTTETSAPIARAGWLSDIPNSEEPTQASAPGHHLLSIYGMSFVEQVGNTIHEIDPTLELRQHLGPAAPPNHSFAAYRLDRGHHQADVVVWGILASSVEGMDAMSGMSLMTDFPAPYTFPRYELKNGQLEETMPLVRSLDQLRETRQDAQKRDAFTNQLLQNDRLIDPLIYEQNWLDQSAIVRLLRRSWTKSHQARVQSQIHDQNGFNPNWQQGAVLKAMVEDFGKSVRADGKIPIVILFNDRGFDDDLYQLLAPTLTAANIPYVSTHSIAPATDPTNFIGDGHFTETANRKISEQTLQVIRQQLQQAGK